MEKQLKEKGYETKRYGNTYLENALRQILWSSTDRRTPIDLHWNLIEKFSADLPEAFVWKNSFSEVIDGVEVRFLSDELFFLYLCLVLWKEAGTETSVKYFLDLYWFFENHKQSLDYEHIIKTAEQYNLKHCLLFFFSLSCQELGIDHQLTDPLQQYVNQPCSVKKVLEWLIRTRQLCPQRKAFLLRKATASAFFVAKGSCLGMLKWFYLNWKANYLLNLYFGNSKPTTGNFIKHILTVVRKLSA